MHRSRMLKRCAHLGATLLSLALAGCAEWRAPRIDPSGERLFADTPGAHPTAFVDEPGRRSPHAPVAVTLNPATTVAPIGHEVVLVAGVRGPDNYLRTGQRLEWSLTQGSVGHFVAVGRNEFCERLWGAPDPKKIDNTYAIGSTSGEYLRINRGRPTREDDVYVLAGQGWISLTSPMEGTSQVTVFAPEVPAWDCRTRSATVHWIDAAWSLPPTAINPAGTRHALVTTVQRQSDRTPLERWQVRYDIVDGPPAGFLPDGTPSVVVDTNASGQGVAELLQKQAMPGTNQIRISIIRPGSAPGANGRALTYLGGMTTKTWTAPALSVKKAGPPVSGVGGVMTYCTTVTNAGDQPARDVVLVEDVPPDLVSYVSSRPAGEQAGRRLTWRLGTLGARESRTIEANYKALQLGSVRICCTATAANGLKAADCATTTITPPATGIAPAAPGTPASGAPPTAGSTPIQLQITGPTQGVVGKPVDFNISLVNRGNTPVSGLLLRDILDEGLEHETIRKRVIENKRIPTLAPGQSANLPTLTFQITKPGTLCQTIEIYVGATQVVRERRCLTAYPAAGPSGPTPGAGGPSLGAGTATAGPPARADGVAEPGRLAPSGAPATAPDTAPSGPPTDRTPPSPADEPGGTRPDTSPGARSFAPGVGATIPGLGPRPGWGGTVPGAGSIGPGLGLPGRGTTPGTGAADTADTEAGAGGPTMRGLEISCSDVDDPVNAGRKVTYVINVTNRGADPDRMVEVSLTVPVGMSLEPMGSTGPTPQTWVRIEGKTARFNMAPVIQPGETLTYRVVALTRQPGKQTVRAEVTSQRHKQPLVAEETTTVNP